VDDILIFSKGPEGQQQHIRQGLQRLLENKLFLKAEKCEFHASSVSFLGYITAQGQLWVDPAKVRAVTEWPVLSKSEADTAFPGVCPFLQTFHP
jgi:hypothetical protein